MAMTDPPHPGESIRLLCMEPLGLTVAETARRLGVSRKQLSAVLNGRAGISPEMAVRLAAVFGSNARTWHALQAACDIAEVLARADEIVIPEPMPA